VQAGKQSLYTWRPTSALKLLKVLEVFFDFSGTGKFSKSKRVIESFGFRWNSFSKVLEFPFFEIILAVM